MWEWHHQDGGTGASWLHPLSQEEQSSTILSENSQTRGWGWRPSRTTGARTDCTGREEEGLPVRPHRPFPRPGWHHTEGSPLGFQLLQWTQGGRLCFSSESSMVGTLNNLLYSHILYSRKNECTVTYNTMEKSQTWYWAKKKKKKSQNKNKYESSRIDKINLWWQKLTQLFMIYFFKYSRKNTYNPILQPIIY